MTPVYIPALLFDRTPLPTPTRVLTVMNDASFAGRISFMLTRRILSPWPRMQRHAPMVIHTLARL